MPDAPDTILDAIPTLEPAPPAEEFVTWESIIGYGMGGLVILTLLATIVILALRARRQRQAAEAPGPLESALATLSQLEEGLPPLRPCALRLSLLLRTYLAGCTEDPSLYETQEEFSQRMDSLAGVPAALRPELRELLDELADYKYAAEQLTGGTDVRTLLSRARDLLIRLDTARAEEEARHREEGGAA